LNSQKVIITGGPGFGKTSIIEELEARKYRCAHEVSRAIIKSQLEIGGQILPWKDIKLFSEILLESRIKQFEQAYFDEITFFDRGIPDIIAYMKKDAILIPDSYSSMLDEYVYFSSVFIVPPWREIYNKDAERREDYDTAVDIHKYISDTYEKLGYKTIVLPKVSVIERANYILQYLFEGSN
jgi:predicted ATPase